MWRAINGDNIKFTGVQEQTLTSAVNGVGLVCMECAH